MREIGAFAVADAASYRGNFPTFSQPKEVACFSRDASRAVKFDKSALRKYRPAQLPVPLDEEFEAYTPKAAGDEPAPLGDVLGALKHANAPPRPGTIITFRNNLNKLFLTPYQPRDDWEIGVAPLADGSIELHVRDTARKAAEEASRDERGRRMCYWGYRFEQLSTLSADEASALARARQAQGGGGGGYRVPSPSDQGSYEHLMTAEEAEAVHERSGPAGPTGAASNGAAPTVAAAVGAVDANVEFCSVVSVTIAKVCVARAL